MTATADFRRAVATEPVRIRGFVLADVRRRAAAERRSIRAVVEQAIAQYLASPSGRL